MLNSLPNTKFLKMQRLSGLNTPSLKQGKKEQNWSQIQLLQATIRIIFIILKMLDYSFRHCIAFVSEVHCKHCKTSEKVSASRRPFTYTNLARIAFQITKCEKGIFHFFVSAFLTVAMGTICNLLVSISYFSSVQ